MKKKVIIIVGATGSGKSALALQMALEYGGVVINADSMQVYSDLSVLTARPSVADMEKVPHKLYGFLRGGQNCSAAVWAKLAAKEIKQAWNSNLLPIVVGGTGLYISALVDGLAPVPDIPDSIRKEVRRMSVDEAKEQLKIVDPSFSFTDRQRVLRALEVYLATGRTHSSWQKEPRQQLLPEAFFEKHFLNPDRVQLYDNLDKRFLGMLKAGAVKEVEKLIEQNYDARRPIMKALGVPEIKSFLDGAISYDEMIAKAQQSTRNYAKRQITWFKHQLGD